MGRASLKFIGDKITQETSCSARKLDPLFTEMTDLQDIVVSFVAVSIGNGFKTLHFDRLCFYVNCLDL